MYRYNTSEKSGPNFITPSRDQALGFVTRLSDVFMTWLDRSRQRQHLAELDERMLRDIGLSRGDVETEVTRRFWQAYE